MTVSAAEYRARKTSKIDLAPRTIPGGTLTEIDTLVVQLRDAGLPVGAGIEKSLAIRNATMGVASSPEDYYPADVLSLTPAKAVEAMRAYAVDLATEAVDVETVRPIETARRHLEGRLQEAAQRELTANSGETIAAMQEKVEAAWQVVTKAASLGITPETTAEQIATEGTDEELAAYRALLEAVPTLTQMARLRVQLATVGGVGVTSVPALNIMGKVTRPEQVQGWQNIYRGESEVVSIEEDWRAYSVGTAPVARLGAGWLDLALAGYSVKINTAEEAKALADLI
ncbi:hypothetical protein [Dermacoccus sp. Ellin185]|uniref:hypothetical protein n=1 Tax=Dermacoccus sp. Ellin185 TaxID=188626 RepID=UPI0001E63B2D|nr:hypothetical protein [Dermacoccus sp. Ellin185]EFP59516.1 hypothetical protein HMPREF0321_2479 [Dermacoccus sp. Ellin185]